MVWRAVRTGVVVGVAVAAWVTLRADAYAIAVLAIGLPIGVGLGAALGLVGGLALLAGWARWQGSVAVAATLAIILLLFGAEPRDVAIRAVAPVLVMSWLALLVVDRRESRAR